MRKGPTTSSGFVLIAVLWIIATLSTLATIYALYVNATATGLNAYDRELIAEGASRAAVELAALRILSTPEQARPHSGKLELVLGNTQVRARYESEGCRVDLNSASKELLEALFLASGAADDAATLWQPPWPRARRARLGVASGGRLCAVFWGHCWAAAAAGNLVLVGETR